jgi:hypothetical protein
MTGRTGSPGPGVKTLRNRQSSLDGRRRAPRKLSVAEGFWGAIGPNAVAWRTPAHGSAGEGGRKRSARAYGMPRNWWAPRLSRPWTLPVSVSTITRRTLPAETDSTPWRGPAAAPEPRQGRSVRYVAIERA